MIDTPARRKARKKLKRDPHSFGNSIRRLREAQNMRPELLAVNCDCSITAIHDWESRDTTPVHLARFKRLADTLGITLDELASFGAVLDHEEAAA